MYRLFVGIDVSKAWIDASYTEGPDPKYLGQFDNSISGFKELLKAVRGVTAVKRSAWFFCFENTGTYSKELLQWLCSQEIACREESALKIAKESGLRRGKSDKIDSQLICQYSFKNRDSIQATKLSGPNIQLIKKLLSRRAFLVRQRAARMVSLKEQRAEFPSQLLEVLEAQDKEAIGKLGEDIQFVEKEIKRLIDASTELKKNNRLAQSVTGVGHVIAWHIIAYTNNFEDFSNYKSFAAYCGIAPFPNKSGSTRNFRNRVSPIANRRIKALIANGVIAAMTHDTEIRLYSQRKLQEGKESGCVKNAVKNKLIARVFAVVKRGTPFVSTHNYA
jgi:transposase